MFVSLNVFLIALVVSFILGLISPILFMLYCVMRAEVPRVTSHEVAEG